MWTYSLIIGITCTCNTFSSAFENIALQKPTYQKHQYLRLADSLTRASNAVDGLKTNLSVLGAQCVISENDQPSALLWVNLTSILSIHHINIYFRTENNPWKCAVGFYGDGCQKQCRHCINMMQCHHVNGTCLGGCEPGYKGDNCMQVCDIGTFGLHCNEICGQCQDLNDCLQTNGSCLSGCSSGYQGDLCKTTCPNGTFGLGCDNDCNSTCRGCNNINGLCDTGCYPGWKGIYCHQTCSFGYYGDNCSMNCGYCLNYETCHHINGSCLSGCQSGFQVPLCANVYQPLNSSNNQQSSFYSVLGLFCVSLILNGVFIAYIIILRKSRNRGTKVYKPESSSKEIRKREDETAGFDSVNEGYQELGELSRSNTTYDYVS
uniref:Platelet endothelial aggregation receptor 1-like isoform X2 n=1 Tax=Crassostrea virginica TaxID=6565 RepID=A0A8B8BSZ5_CRAVI|nr:platelet endothelial aggregation receptor 1-like isoform X2 [Crassostrea virginica]